MTDEIPIAGGRDGAAAQSPCGAGVIAPASLPQTADAVKWQAASDFLAGIDLKDNAQWSLARTTQLVYLWFQGLSTRLIGMAIGVTKNAVVGQVHRMALPGRPSPIPSRWSGQRTPAAPKASKHALAPLPTEAPLPPTRTAGCAPPLRLVAPPPVETVWRARAHAPCCWPIGEPGTKSFRFCEADGVPGKPYCRAHMRKAYIPVIRREPDARDRNNRDSRCT